MKSISRRGALAAAAVLLLLLSLAPLAQASYDALGGGTTRLVLEKSFTRFLNRNGIEISATEGARLKGRAIVLPVAGGKIDPTTAKGTIEQGGTISFVGRKKVPLRRIVVKTTRSPLIAKVGGGQLKVATSSKLGSKREGFLTKFSARRLELTAKAATRLNKKLRPPKPFEAGQRVGSVVAKAEPLTTKTLATNRVTFTFAPSLLAKLESLFVSLNPIAPAERAVGTGSAIFTMPINAEGSIAPSGRGGVLYTTGAIELLQLHAGQIFWRMLSFDLGQGVVGAEVDIEPTPAFPGKLGPVSTLDMAMDSASIAPNPKARTVTVSGAPLALQAGTAAYFNQAFGAGKEVFQAGEEVGTVSFVAQGQ